MSTIYAVPYKTVKKCNENEKKIHKVIEETMDNVQNNVAQLAQLLYFSLAAKEKKIQKYLLDDKHKM